MNLRYIIMQPEHILGNVIGEIFCKRINANVGFIRNYLSKEVRKLKLECGQFNTLIINLDPVTECCYKWDEKTIRVCLKYTKEDASALSKICNLEHRYEYFLSLFAKGYRLAISEGFHLPLTELLQLHEQFRQNNYKNNWVWKKKTLRNIGKKLVFFCNFTTFDFTFCLALYDLKGNLLAKKILMRTPPFEVCYEKDFRKLAVCEEKLLILDFLDHPSFEIDLNRLEKECIISKQLNVIERIQKKYKELFYEIIW